MRASLSNNRVLPSRRSTPRHGPPRSNSSKQFQGFQRGFSNGVAKTLAFSMTPSELQRRNICTMSCAEKLVARVAMNITIGWKLASV